MNGYSRRFTWAILALLMIGCAPSQVQPSPTAIPTFTAPPPATTVPSPTPEVSCRWKGLVVAWADTDRDGVREPGEPPLADVNFTLAYQGRVDNSTAYPTDERGEYAFDIRTGDCDLQNYEILLDTIPEGYALPEKITQTLSADSSVLSFGLVPLAPGETSEAQFRIDACNALSHDQAESILGPMSMDPSPLETVGSNAISASMCVYEGTLNQAIVGLSWYGSPERAHEIYLAASAEPLSGLGDEAMWDEPTRWLRVRQGKLLFSIEMRSPENAREQAIQLARIIVVRVQ